jgi:GT2 family glycosyltransferase
MKKRILVGSPIHQKPKVLEKFLKSLSIIKKNTIELDFFLIDDNNLKEASNLLKEFGEKNSNVKIIKSNDLDEYICNDVTHIWNEKLIWKVADFKNLIIEEALNNNYDYLFLIDSDLLLHPNTIQHLTSLNLDIVSTVFWTSWQPDTPLLPQVWLYDQYTQYVNKRGESLTEQEKLKRHADFLSKLKEPGTYEVGGLGACTLISSNALKAGVNFSEIKNLSFWGEDRHFCIRAVALGFSLFVDTNYPAYHIYRENDLLNVDSFNHKCEDRELFLKLYFQVKYGFERLGTFDYSKSRDQSWTVYFTENMIEFLNSEKSSSYNNDIKSQLSVCAFISNFSIYEINKKDETVIVNFNLINRGVENGIEFKDEYLCQAQLKYAGNWLIDYFEIIK